MSEFLVAGRKNYLPAIDFSERVSSFFGIAANLISYLTKVMHEHLKTAAKKMYPLLCLLSLSTGGHKPCLERFGADQYSMKHTSKKGRRKCRFPTSETLQCVYCFALLLGATVIVSWGASSLILTILMALLCIIAFYLGKSFYRYIRP
ncbi:hypothetical protein TSUD_358870 [Trifolium subterraneum]|uniref:Uncharacterized protein n=1 Tax=Trifolium subterraneum TaxID=3900 RepID=A0A2Z6N9W0_TRISU|nr:hypothetical protein TSUD_358870 [Trifolium subterraneum]